MNVLELILTSVALYLAVLIGLAIPPVVAVVVTVALLLTLQGALATYAMFYSFLEERRLHRILPEKEIARGKTNQTFSLIVPARNEKHVIGDTLQAMARLDYPQSQYEVLVLVRADDTATLQETQKALEKIKRETFRLIPIDGDANTKAYSLNIGAHYAKNEVIAIFDAEDEPHPELLSHVAATFAKDNQLSVVQAGIQLINVTSRWFSALNSLEYYFWFKSVLPFLAQLGVTPLGGNTVFIKREAVEAIGRWDEACLTEDMDIGVRLAQYGFKTKVIYQEHLATLEETPKDELGFIKQRSRWDQGYLQVFLKGDWLRFPDWRQRLMTGYVLVQTLFRHVAFVFMALLPISLRFLEVPLPVALLSYIPLYFLGLQWGLYLVALRDLKRYYGLQFNPALYLKMLASFFPYQVMLFTASLRAFARWLFKVEVWEKTAHRNLHRLNLRYRTR